MSELKRHSAGTVSDLDFELPDPHGFVSQPVPVSAEMIFKLSEERLPFVTTRPGFHERRLAEKVSVPFEM
jgi:hypothetical protein